MMRYSYLAWFLKNRNKKSKKQRYLVEAVIGDNERVLPSYLKSLFLIKTGMNV